LVWFFRFFSHFPLWSLHMAGWMLGWLAFLGSGVYRRRFLDNARRAGFDLSDMWPAVGHSGKLIAELPRLWLGAPVPVTLLGFEHIDAALAAGKGIVALTPHLGCFEVAAQAYAQRYADAGRPMTVLYRPPRKAWLARLMQGARERPGLLTAPTTLGGVKSMLKALKKGDAVGLLPDQVPPDGMGVWASFFGEPAYTMTLSARLVQPTGACILLANCERLSWGRGFVVRYEPWPVALGPLSTEPDEAAAQVNAAMQGLIARYPQQYLWGYARYKAPRREVAA
jgi:Kdo2-lipid IVA lauroyltransferase/acyltransferase